MARVPEKQKLRSKVSDYSIAALYISFFSYLKQVEK